MIETGVRPWGFKALVFNTRKKLLTSPSMLLEWPQGEVIKAQCNKNRNHTNPPYFEECGCGIHATWLLRIAYRYVNQLACVLVMLEGGGNVVTQSTGFRAEEVNLILVSTPPSEDPKTRAHLFYMAQAVSETYGLTYLEWDMFSYAMDMNNFLLNIKDYRPYSKEGLKLEKEKHNVV